MADNSFTNLIVGSAIFNLIKEGKATQVLTWKKLHTKPDAINIFQVGSDEYLTLRVTNMDIVPEGYTPKGYPKNLRSKMEMVRLQFQVQ